MRIKYMTYLNLDGEEVSLDKSQHKESIFQYVKDGVVISVGTREQIAKQLGISLSALKHRLANTRRNSTPVKHELKIVEVKGK